MPQLPLVPPLVELGRALGWQPLPLTIKEGRPFARRISQQLAAAVAARPSAASVSQLASEGRPERRPAQPEEAKPNDVPRPGPAAPIISVRNIHYAYHGHRALRGVSLDVRAGRVSRADGAQRLGQKHAAASCFVGLLKPDEGEVTVGGLDVRTANMDDVIQQVGYVPQHPGSLLFRDTVAGELAFTRQEPRDAAGPGGRPGAVGAARAGGAGAARPTRS